MGGMNHVEAVRGFNRFYTRRIGVVKPGMVGSPFTLAEARVLYALGRDGETTATAIGRELSLDLGYLSRLLQTLRRRGLIQAKRATHDARHQHLTLTGKGRKAFTLIDSRSRDEMAQMLAPLEAKERGRLVSAMQTVEALLKSDKAPGEITLREHRPGDMGWVVERHAVLYNQQDGWGLAFEALVAGIVKDFIDDFDARREHCWIAERNGERLGCVFVVNDKGNARLRLLLVEPSARGTGLGRRLVDECIRFSREKGYKKLVLWTHAHLLAARAIYAKTGFRKLKKTEVHDTFGPRAVSEFWELVL
ncbi:MAG: MarR family transcriptional regulator [Betaproteobacteria bacterium]|nr:MarR family transcriptional regulator [Betaproteobacteria bacterium]MBV9359856.1 MarR family transcriptional regulator [Betaproteobacteria bacterium]